MANVLKLVTLISLRHRGTALYNDQLTAVAEAEGSTSPTIRPNTGFHLLPT